LAPALADLLLGKSRSEMGFVREIVFSCKNVNYEIVAEPNSPVSKAVAEANNDTIVMSFNVEANGPEESVASSMSPGSLTTDVPENQCPVPAAGTGNGCKPLL
jgi:hypothetical protein